MDKFTYCINLILSVFVIICILPGLSEGYAFEDKYLSLDEVVNKAMEMNPDIKAAKGRWDAVVEKAPQARSLPDPDFQYSYMGEHIETRIGPMEDKYMLSQKFPSFGKLHLRGTIAEKDAEIMYRMYEEKVLEVTSKVKTAYYELYWVDKAIRINEENKILLKQFEKLAETKYETGEVSQQDVLKAQVELSKLENDIITLKQLRETAAARINTLIDMPPESYLLPPADFGKTPFPMGLEELYQKTIELKPQLKAYRELIEKNELNYALSRKEYYPDFKLGFEYTTIGSGTTSMSKDGQDAWAVLLGINIPLWHGRISSGVKEAGKNLQASKDAYENAENLSLFDVKDMHFKLLTADRLINLYRTSIIPQAEQSLKASEIGYETGKVDFLNFIDSQRTLLNFNLAYYRALVDYEKTLAEMERAVGMKLSE